MPKVIIKEYDNTIAGAPEYSNFAVVYPGYVDEDKVDDWAKVADENGVFECHSAKDFVDYIGKVNAQDSEKANPPEGVKTFAAGDLTKDDTGKVTYVEDGETHELHYEIDGTGNFYKKVESSGKAGYLDDGTDAYENVAVTALDWDKDTNKNKVEAYWIENGNEGNDEVAERISNRDAFLLVSLGYTVLYKRVENEDEVKEAEFWDCFKDKALYDFRYIVSGGRFDGEVYKHMSNVAGHWANVKEDDETTDSCSGRGDAVALLDVIEDDLNLTKKDQSSVVSAIIDQINGADEWYNCAEHPGNKDVGSYAPTFTPSVIIKVNQDDTYVNEANDTLTIPGSIYYLACAAKASENYNEWYAVAGYTRGVSDFTVVGTTLSLGERAINELSPRAYKANGIKRSVNVITKLRTVGNNFYLWGSRTAKLLGDELIASHFLNIRQLCSTIKKSVYVACKKLTFSPNDMILWADFQEKVRPTLESMKSDRGIADYKFIKVKSKKKATLCGKIKIVPIEAVEDFNIGVYLVDSVNGVDVAVDED